MNVNQITVKIDQRIKIMDFESFAPNVEMSATLNEKDDPKKCTEELFAMARQLWAKEAMKELRWNRSRSKEPELFSQLAETTVTALKKMMVDGK